MQPTKTSGDFQRTSVFFPARASVQHPARAFAQQPPVSTNTDATGTPSTGQGTITVTSSSAGGDGHHISPTDENDFFQKPQTRGTSVSSTNTTSDSSTNTCVSEASASQSVHPKTDKKTKPQSKPQRDSTSKASKTNKPVPTDSVPTDSVPKLKASGGGGGKEAVPKPKSSTSDKFDAQQVDVRRWFGCTGIRCQMEGNSRYRPTPNGYGNAGLGDCGRGSTSRRKTDGAIDSNHVLTC